MSHGEGTPLVLTHTESSLASPDTMAQLRCTRCLRIKLQKTHMDTEAVICTHTFFTSSHQRKFLGKKDRKHYL